MTHFNRGCCALVSHSTRHDPGATHCVTMWSLPHNRPAEIMTFPITQAYWKETNKIKFPANLIKGEIKDYSRFYFKV